MAVVIKLLINLPRIMAEVNYDFETKSNYVFIDDIQTTDKEIGNGSIAMKYFINEAAKTEATYISGSLSYVDRDHFDRLEHFYKKFRFEVNFNATKTSGTTKKCYKKWHCSLLNRLLFDGYLYNNTKTLVSLYYYIFYYYLISIGAERMLEFEVEMRQSNQILLATVIEYELVAMINHPITGLKPYPMTVRYLNGMVIYQTNILERDFPNVQLKRSNFKYEDICKITRRVTVTI